MPRCELPIQVPPTPHSAQLKREGRLMNVAGGNEKQFRKCLARPARPISEPGDLERSLVKARVDL